MSAGVPSLVLVIALVGANPDWPFSDPGLPPTALQSPDRWPDDPGFGPGAECQGQWGLFSFVPDCAEAVSDRASSAGARVDRAWLWTIGQPEITIAALDDGPSADDRDLITQWRLNEGELAPPGSGTHDVNDDGVFDVRDYTTATGTETPTVDRVNAPALLDRADRGDVNGNGLLDPQDILQIFADGEDDDGNGFIDDICGWDFVDDDADPFDGPVRITPAHWALARANDGFGLAGACPACSGLPLRVAIRGETEPAALSLAVLYAADRDARVAMVAAATWGDRPQLHEAVEEATRRGTLVILGRGRHPGRTDPVTWRSDRVLQVGSVGPDDPDLTRATRFDAQDPCGGVGAAVDAPGACDDAGLGIAAGSAGLIWTAAAGLPERGFAPWSTPPSPLEVRALLAAERLDARAAVDATLEQRAPTPSVIDSPADRAVFDPSRAEPIPFRARIVRPRPRAVTWSLEAGVGLQPAFVLIESGRIEPDEPELISVAVPSVGWTRDPTTAVRTPSAFALTLRLTVRSVIGEQPVQAQFRRVVHVHRDLMLLPAFPLQLPSGVTGATRLVDLDNNRRAKIVVSTQDGQLLTVTATGGIEVLLRAPPWPPLNPDRLGSHATAPLFQSGLTGDWRDALPAGSTARRFNMPPRLWSMTASGIPVAWGNPQIAGATPERPGQAWRPVALDSTDGAYYVDAENRLHVIDSDGRPRDGFPVALGPGASAPAIGDLDGDERADVVVAGASRVWRIRPEGAAHPDGPFPPGWPIELARTDDDAVGLAVGQGPSVVFVDLNGDESVDILVAGAGRPLLAFNAEGRTIAVGPVATRALTGAVAVGPLDDPDMVWSLLAAGSPAAPGRALDAFASATVWPDGVAPAAYPVPWAEVPPLEPVMIDLEGDDRAEALWPEAPDRLRAIDRDGNPPAGWPKLVGDEIAGAPAVGDLDGDGRREIVVATRRGRLFAWRTSAETVDAAPWDGHRHDLRASGDLRSPTRPVAVDNEGCGCSAVEARTRPRWSLALWALIALLGIRSCLGGRTR